MVKYVQNLVKDNSMKTLAEEYVFKILKEAVKVGQITKTGLVASAVGGGLVGLASYYLYKKYKQAQVRAQLEKDPSKRNELNVKANDLKQKANKTKMDEQKKKQLQQRMKQ